jgi:hypothetical protein
MLRREFVDKERGGKSQSPSATGFWGDEMV